MGGNSTLTLNLRPSPSGKRLAGTVPTKIVEVINKAIAPKANILAVVLLRMVAAQAPIAEFFSSCFCQAIDLTFLTFSFNIAQ